jgi:hypothetical protein
MDDESRRYVKLIRHALFQGLLLSVWIVTAWVTDQYLLGRFPLEGLSIISFRLLEVALHVSTFRVVYKLLFTDHERPSRLWWR